MMLGKKLAKRCEIKYILKKGVITPSRRPPWPPISRARAGGGWLSGPLLLSMALQKAAPGKGGPYSVCQDVMWKLSLQLFKIMSQTKNS